MTCNQCDFQNEETAKFCRNCGAELKKTREAKRTKGKGAKKETKKPSEKAEKSKDKPPKAKSDTKFFLWYVIVIASLAFFGYFFDDIVRLYSNNKNRGHQIFVSHRCEPSMQMQVPRISLYNPWRVVSPEEATIVLCVMREKVFVYCSAERKRRIRGYLIRYDKVVASYRSERNGFVEIFDGGRGDQTRLVPLGWVRLSDVMQSVN